jgi:GT2 family glycosyltransferase
MIPVIGIPVLNRPDLLERCLDSIDAEVGTLLVIDNGGFVERPDAVVVRPPVNLGVPASWNRIIEWYPDAAWWLISNADIAFGPGDLEQLAISVEQQPDAISCLVEFGAFAVTPSVVDRVGWFDENFHPIYYEDSDYRYRCHLEGVPIVNVANSTVHAGSAALHAGHDGDNSRTFPSNGDYYREKWGGSKGQETHRTPFGLPVPTSYWHLRRQRLVDQRWSRMEP